MLYDGISKGLKISRDPVGKKKITLIKEIKRAD